MLLLSFAFKIRLPVPCCCMCCVILPSVCLPDSVLLLAMQESDECGQAWPPGCLAAAAYAPSSCPACGMNRCRSCLRCLIFFSSFAVQGGDQQEEALLLLPVLHHHSRRRHHRLLLPKSDRIASCPPWLDTVRRVVVCLICSGVINTASDTARTQIVSACSILVVFVIVVN